MPDRAWRRRPAGPQGDARLTGSAPGFRATHGTSRGVAGRDRNCGGMASTPPPKGVRAALDLSAPGLGVWPRLPCARPGTRARRFSEGALLEKFRGTKIISAKISWGRPFGGHSWRPAGQLGGGPWANFRAVPARSPTQRQRRQRLQRGTYTNGRPLPHLTFHGWGHAACQHPRPRQDAGPTSRTVPPCAGALPCTPFPADTAPSPPPTPL